MPAILNFFTFLLNFTWGIIQSAVGLIMFLLYIKKPHFRYKGSIVTINSIPVGGISLGAFIFTADNVAKEHANKGELIKHEYGHCLQSLLLGPLYLVIIGLPDIIWLICFARWREKHNKSYYWFFTESWADNWGNVNR